jgi:hypothetical protein
MRVRDLVNPGSGIGIRDGKKSDLGFLIRDEHPGSATQHGGRILVILPRTRISVTIQMKPAYYLRLFFILLAKSIYSCLPVSADSFLLFPMLLFLDWNRNAVGVDFLAGRRIFA